MLGASASVVGRLTLADAEQAPTLETADITRRLDLCGRVLGRLQRPGELDGWVSALERMPGAVDGLASTSPDGPAADLAAALAPQLANLPYSLQRLWSGALSRAPGSITVIGPAPEEVVEPPEDAAEPAEDGAGESDDAAAKKGPAKRRGGSTAKRGGSKRTRGGKAGKDADADGLDSAPPKTTKKSAASSKLDAAAAPSTSGASHLARVY